MSRGFDKVHSGDAKRRKQFITGRQLRIEASKISYNPQKNDRSKVNHHFKKLNKTPNAEIKTTRMNSTVKWNHRKFKIINKKIHKKNIKLMNWVQYIQEMNVL